MCLDNVLQCGLFINYIAGFSIIIYLIFKGGFTPNYRRRFKNQLIITTFGFIGGLIGMILAGYALYLKGER